MGEYWGACADCGEKGSLIAVDRGNERWDRICSVCYNTWLDNLPPAPEPLRQDPDDERKYGRYNY